jgi:hypothetical protein
VSLLDAMIRCAVALAIGALVLVGCGHCVIDPKDCVGYGRFHCIPDDVDAGPP